MTVRDPYAGSYRDVGVHRMMLLDVVRTEAYQRTLDRVVTPGCKVLDFGCGSGVLSIFASRAGAGKVYAVDESIFIQKAHAIARQNEIDNIAFYYNNHLDLKLDTEVDIHARPAAARARQVPRRGGQDDPGRGLVERGPGHG